MIYLRTCILPPPTIPVPCQCGAGMVAPNIMLRVVLAGQREGTQAHAFFPFLGFRVTAGGIQRPPLFGALETRWSVPGMETGGPHVPSLCPSLGASSQPHFFFIISLGSRYNKKALSFIIPRYNLSIKRKRHFLLSCSGGWR